MFSFLRKRPSGFKVLDNDKYFGILIQNPKNKYNVGTILRTAHNFGASFVFTTGEEYVRQPGDVNHVEKHIPFMHFDSIDDALKAIPRKCKLVVVKQSKKSVDLITAQHPKRAIYVFGNELTGVEQSLVNRANLAISINTIGCMNVAVTAGIIMYDRFLKLKGK